MRKRRELLSFGPSFPDSYDPSNFSFQALVIANSPMVIEYEMEDEGTALVTIKVKDAAPFTQTLNGEGIGEPRTARFTLPDYAGNGPHPALITFKATRPGPSGDERAEFVFLGSAMGKEGVGARLHKSDVMEVAGLGPLLPGGSRPPAGHQPARPLNVYDVTLDQRQGTYVYTFYVADKFNRWAADIKTDIRKRNRQVARTVRHAALVDEPIGPNLNPVSDHWDGRDDNGRKVRGMKVWVFVRTWLSAESRGAWAADNRSPRYPIN